jgi:16S rRNA (adenine1518-N6/adenine1519-N6)-dimethyltransferase
LSKLPTVQLKSIEIDPRSEEYLAKLKEEYPNFDFMITDASKYDYSDLDLVVGNLPYNIGTNILLSCVRSGVKRMVFLLQAEVVDRVVAKPKSADYGSLSVLVQAYYEVKSVLKIPPPAFNPAPSVYSKLLVCDIKADSHLKLPYASLASLLRRSFQQPRKTLQNNLGKDFIQATKLNPMIRPNCLSVSDYIGLLPHFSLITGHINGE